LTRTGLRINRYCSMSDFPFFQSTSEADYASSSQTLRRSVKPFLRYGLFSIFKKSTVRDSWICFTPVGTTHEEYLLVFATVQNLVVIGAVVSIVCKASVRSKRLNISSPNQPHTIAQRPYTFFDNRDLVKLQSPQSNADRGVSGFC